MKLDEIRQKLARLSADDVRVVAAQLYRMLPKKLAEQKGADHLISDPEGFLNSAKAKKAPDLPEIGLVEFDTQEFIKNASEQRYFAPNRIISKAERGKWRFVARQLYKDWCLLAGASENRAASAKALEDLYRILCRGCEVYLFPSTDTFKAIGVPQEAYLEQLLALKAQLFPPAEWITQALSLVQMGAHGDTTTTQLQDAFLSTLKTPDLKESALDVVTCRLSRSERPASRGEVNESWRQTRVRRDLLRLGFQVAWALGEKERAVQWLRTHSQGGEADGNLVMRSLLETGDREIWMREFESVRLAHPSVADSWKKTFEQALQGELPASQVS